ncbi:MAG: hypothetical protein R2856_19885 [Caldilineaceae bacterium]
MNLTLLVMPNDGAALGDWHGDGVPSNTTAALWQAQPHGHGGGSRRAGADPRRAGSIDPREGGTWNVQVRNAGQVEDTFRLGVTGPVAGAAGLSASSVTLGAGRDGDGSLACGESPSTIMPGGYLPGDGDVRDGNNNVSDNDQTSVNVNGFEEIDVSWLQVSQTVDDGLSGAVHVSGNESGQQQRRIQCGSGCRRRHGDSGRAVDPVATRRHHPDPGDGHR